MADWVLWAAGGAGALIIVVGLVLLAVVAWRNWERRYVIRLVADREAVRAGFRTLEQVVTRLADAADDELVGFASDPSRLDRKALSEVHRQQEIVRDQLDAARLPKRLWDTADRLGAAAGTVGREAGRVGENADVGQVLEGLSAIDLAAAKAAVAEADEAVRVVSEAFGVQDAAVYGGGLYI